jgi:hypothetical protein
MARSLATIRVTGQVSAQIRNDVSGSVVVSADQGFTFTPLTALATGTAANQADRIWQSRGRALADGTNEDLDIYDFAGLDIGAGAGEDAVGQPMILAEVVALMIVNTSTTAATITIGGEGSTAAWNSPFGGSDTNTIGPIPPGGCLLLFSPKDGGWPVADTSNHLLQVAAAGAAATYDIVILGKSA